MQAHDAAAAGGGCGKAEKTEQSSEEPLTFLEQGEKRPSEALEHWTARGLATSESSPGRIDILVSWEDSEVAKGRSQAAEPNTQPEGSPSGQRTEEALTQPHPSPQMTEDRRTKASPPGAGDADSSTHPPSPSLQLEVGAMAVAAAAAAATPLASVKMEMPQRTGLAGCKCHAEESDFQNSEGEKQTETRTEALISGPPRTSKTGATAEEQPLTNGEIMPFDPLGHGASTHGAAGPALKHRGLPSGDGRKGGAGECCQSPQANRDSPGNGLQRRKVRGRSVTAAEGGRAAGSESNADGENDGEDKALGRGRGGRPRNLPNLFHHWLHKFLRPFLQLDSILALATTGAIVALACTQQQSSRRRHLSGRGTWQPVGRRAATGWRAATASALEAFEDLVKAKKGPEPGATHKEEKEKEKEEDLQVHEGDTLWSLSERLLGKPRLWPCLHQACRGQLGSDPRSITCGADLADCMPAALACASRHSTSTAGLDHSSPSPKGHAVTTKVKEGDTLWDISEQLTGDGHYWPGIVSANVEKFLYFPHLRIGTQGVLVPVQGGHLRPGWELCVPLTTPRPGETTLSQGQPKC